jgi:thioredoxin reductase (NADPH)
MSKHSQVIIVGAGPLGLELAIGLKQSGIDYLHLDAGQVGQAIFDFPPQTRFFSSSERIGIAKIPLQTVDQEKCTREAYLAYLRSCVSYFDLKIQSFEKVLSIKESQGFELTTSKGSYTCKFLVLATGGTNHPRRLSVPGEDLPHVFDRLLDPHLFFQKKVAIIGGKNSAAEAALRLFHAKSFPLIVYRGTHLDEKAIKFWLLPELKSRTKKGEIPLHTETKVLEILESKILTNKGEIPCDFVLKAIGFEQDKTLFTQLNIPLEGDAKKPRFNPLTMEIKPNVFVLGTAAGGTQNHYTHYIENTHHHVDLIGKSIAKSLNTSWQGSVSKDFHREESEQ